MDRGTAFQLEFLAVGAVKRRTLVGTVNRPESEEAFPGLFSFQPGVVPFGFVGNDRLLITSLWRSVRRVSSLALAFRP